MSDQATVETVLESLKTLPDLQPTYVVGNMTTYGPKVKKNLDGTMCHVRSTHVQSNKCWLVIVDYEPRKTFRTRTYLRRLDGTLLLLDDKDGFRTMRGAEWAAYMALMKTIRFLQSVRRAGAT